jgi:pyoverdine/dityrosine biosynthesis protein Dit1
MVSFIPPSSPNTMLTNCTDILGVSDLEVWRYGQALRRLAKDRECQNVKFVRLADLLGREYSEPLNEASYLREAATFRNELYDSNLPQGFDVNTFITSDPDATLTYRGYIKFLEKDLEQNTTVNTATSKKRFHEDTAKAMMCRGKVRYHFPSDCCCINSRNRHSQRPSPSGSQTSFDSPSTLRRQMLPSSP